MALCALALAAKDEIIMTVNGIDVPKSEFEYLYHKNSRQQLEAQPLDEYVEMFKLYKLKVADALADRLDTLPEFVKDMKQYRAELAVPYLTDSVYLNTLVDEVYNWSKQEAEARHIMKYKNIHGNFAYERNILDSLRTEIQNGASFEELAAKYSDDKSSSDKGGYMGYITVNRFPYPFEKEAFTLAEGEISQVIETPNTFHILKGGKKRPARGRVLAEHILKLTAPDAKASDADKAKAAARAKEQIDSIYKVVKADPSQFEKLATALSDDKGSARNGGRLNWFSAGQMVPEFDSVAFSLADGEISEPFLTRFGWHIVRKLQQGPSESRDEIAKVVYNRTQNPQDDRLLMVVRNQNKNLAKRFPVEYVQPLWKDMRDYVAVHGMDSTFYDRFGTPAMRERALITLGGKPLTVGTYLDGLNNRRFNDPSLAYEQFQRLEPLFINFHLRQLEMDRLEQAEPDFRNLLNEYRDGSLLYEASVRKVWDKAAKDTEGLEKFYRKHRNDYKWTKPHAKGYLVQASNDSVAQAVKAALGTAPTDSLVKAVRKTFVGKAKIDGVNVPQGENAMVDYLMFGGPKADPSSERFTEMFMVNPRILPQPEEAADVRGQVTTDYQNQLAAEWEAYLKKTYPVKVYKKVVKKVK